MPTPAAKRLSGSGQAASATELCRRRAILYADGGVVIDVSRQATIQMDSLPDSPPTGSTVEVSLWQYGLVGLRAERMLNWKRSRTSAVQLLSPTAYVP